MSDSKNAHTYKQLATVLSFFLSFRKSHRTVLAYKLGGEDSRVWHHGYGGGLWVLPFGHAVLKATYEWSKDEPSGLFSLRFHFLF